MRPRIASHVLFLVVGLTILVGAFALRVHLLGAQSLWNDEGSSYVQATRTWNDIAANAARDIHPPGYYWLLAAWHELTGRSEFALRALSAFASLLTVALTISLGRRLYGTSAGLSAGVLVALNSFSIYYAQEARMYALLAFWSSASMALLLAAWRNRQRPTNYRWALALGLINAAGLYTQYAYVYVLLAQGILMLIGLAGLLRNGRGWRPMLRPAVSYAAANLLALALFAPWLPTALQQIGGWPNTGQPAPWIEALNVILNWLIYGVTSQNGSLAPAWLLLLFGLFIRRRDEGWALLLPVIWVVISVGVFLAQGLYRENNLKFLLPAQIGMALWMGRGFWLLWTLDLPVRVRLRGWRTLGVRAASIAVGLLVIITQWAGVPALYADPAYQRADYRAIAARASMLDESGAVILNGPNQMEAFAYYFDGRAAVIGLPPGLGGNDVETEQLTRAVIENATHILAVFWGDRERDPNRVVEITLDSGAFPVGDQWYGDVRVAEYVMPDAPLNFQPSGQRLGESITLLDYGLPNLTFSPGDSLPVALNWTTDAPLTQRYKVFVQLLHPDGSLAAQHDAEPGGDLRLTTDWQPAAIIEDRHALMIPVDAAPGRYRVITGLYSLDPPYARLTLTDGRDYVLLGEVNVR